MLAVTCVFLPLIIAYTSWVFAVMRGRVTLEHIRRHGIFTDVVLQLDSGIGPGTYLRRAQCHLYEILETQREARRTEQSVPPAL